MDFFSDLFKDCIETIAIGFVIWGLIFAIHYGKETIDYVKQIKCQGYVNKNGDLP